MTITVKNEHGMLLNYQTKVTLFRYYEGISTHKFLKNGKVTFKNSSPISDRVRVKITIEADGYTTLDSSFIWSRNIEHTWYLKDDNKHMIILQKAKSLKKTLTRKEVSVSNAPTLSEQEKENLFLDLVATQEKVRQLEDRIKRKDEDYIILENTYRDLEFDYFDIKDKLYTLQDKYDEVENENRSIKDTLRKAGMELGECKCILWSPGKSNYAQLVFSLVDAKTEKIVTSTEGIIIKVFEEGKNKNPETQLSIFGQDMYETHYYYEKSKGGSTVLLLFDPNEIKTNEGIIRQNYEIVFYHRDLYESNIRKNHPITLGELKILDISKVCEEKKPLKKIGNP
ncbi:MAG: hypothetical protein AAF502_19500 [Bacteroidota bacterium]